MDDLAKQHREKVNDMKKLFLAEEKQTRSSRSGWYLAANPSRRSDQIALYKMDL